MNDHLDLLDHPIDARARSAASDVRAQAMRRAVGMPPAARSTAGRTAALAIVVVALVVAGLIAIGNRADTNDPSSPTDGLQWVVDGLPDGWSASEVRGPGTSSATVDAYTPAMSVFASDDAPEGPLFIVYAFSDTGRVAPGAAGTGAYRGFEQSTIDGVEVVTASDDRGGLVAWSLQGDRWVELHGYRMSLDALTAAAAHLVLAPDLTAAIAPEHLTEGVTRLDAGPLAEVMPASWASIGAQGLVSGTLSITYVSGDGDDEGFVTLSVSETVGAQLAMVGMSGNAVESSVIDGRRIWTERSDSGAVATVSWVDDGRFFVLWSNVGDAVDLTALAAAVRPATSAEWSALPDPMVQYDEPGATVVAGTDAPADTEVVMPGDETAATVTPTGIDEWTDVPLSRTVTDAGPYEATMRVELPDGGVSTVRIVAIAGRISVNDERSGVEMTWPAAEPSIVRAGGPGAFVVTRDPAARQLAVLSGDGNRYIVDLELLDESTGLRVGALALPSQNYADAELLDASGDVLARLG